MRRFWLLLLVVVLPFQMSWAAVHYCDDERLLSTTVEASMTAGHDHDGQTAKQRAGDQNSEKIADACCGASHGCHGLHHLMPHTEASLPSAGRAAVAAARDGPFTCGFLATRVERPKWLAA